MRFSFFTLLVVGLFSFGFAGCKKETAGPKLETTTYTVYYSDWIWNSTDAFLYQDKTWSSITQDIVDNGTVLVYLKTNSGWAPLPRTIALDGILYDYSQSQRYTYNTGGIRLVVQDDDLAQPNSFSDWQIKVVAMSSSQRYANPDLDWNSYEAVKERFNLPN